MADALLGMSTVRELYLELGGVPATGAQLTYTLTSPTQTAAATATTGAGSIVDSGDGWYSVTVAGSALLTPGLYTEVWSGTYTNVFTYNVREDAAFLVAAPAGPLTTLRDLRWAVADELDDLWTGQGSSGSTTTLVDNTLQNVLNDDYFNGGYLYIHAGTGRRQERRISDYAGATGTFTVPALTTGLNNGSYYEVHKRFSVARYNRAIAQALGDAIDQGAKLTVLVELPPFTDTAGDTWLAAAPYEYPLPAGLVIVGDAWAQDTADALLRWRPLHWEPPDGLRRADLYLVPGRRLVRVPGARAGVKLRLAGQLLPGALGRDDAYCDVSPGWLRSRALYYLDASRIQSPALDRDAAAQRTGVWAAASQSALAVYVAPLPNGRRVS